MTSGNAPAAGCSHNRGRCAATLMIACGRADEQSPTAVKRIIVPQVKGVRVVRGRVEPPTFRFQGSRRHLDQDLVGIVTIQLTGIGAGQWAYTVIIATVPPCAA